MPKNKERFASGSFKYSDATSEYSFQQKRKFRWWLIPIILLLFPLLFVIGRLFWFVVNESTEDFANYEESVCGAVTESGGDEGIVKAVNMGQTSGTFLFEYDTYSAWDKITIYNGKQPGGKRIFRYVGGSNEMRQKKVTFNSSDGYICVVVKGLEGGTAWIFTVNCPE